MAVIVAIVYCVLVVSIPHTAYTFLLCLVIIRPFTVAVCILAFVIGIHHNFLLCYTVLLDLQENQKAVFPRLCVKAWFTSYQLIIAMVYFTALSSHSACVVATFRGVANMMHDGDAL